MILLTDVGGTHVRFAHSDGKGIFDVRKYLAADFKSFHEAVDAYRSDCGQSDFDELFVSAARYHAGSQRTARFDGDTQWIVDRQDILKNSSIGYVAMMNDFVAAAGAVPALRDEDVQIIQSGQQKNKTMTMVGLGTGVGVAQLFPVEDQRWMINETFGGHFPVACITQEQWDVVCEIQKIKEQDQIQNHKSFISEDVLTGRGLSHLYRAVCTLAKKECDDSSPQFVTTHARTNNLCGAAVRLLTEFLGIFCNQYVGAAHSFGGLFLTGGVMDVLREQDLFDRDLFLKFLHQDMVRVVDEALRQVHVAFVIHPAPAFSGMLNLRTGNGRSADDSQVFDPRFVKIQSVRGK